MTERSHLDFNIFLENYSALKLGLNFKLGKRNSQYKIIFQMRQTFVISEGHFTFTKIILATYNDQVISKKLLLTTKPVAK